MMPCFTFWDGCELVRFTHELMGFEQFQNQLQKLCSSPWKRKLLETKLFIKDQHIRKHSLSFLVKWKDFWCWFSLLHSSLGTNRLNLSVSYSSSTSPIVPNVDGDSMGLWESKHCWRFWRRLKCKARPSSSRIWTSINSHDMLPSSCMWDSGDTMFELLLLEYHPPILCICCLGWFGGTFVMFGKSLRQTTSATTTISFFLYAICVGQLACHNNSWTYLKWHKSPTITLVVGNSKN